MNNAAGQGKTKPHSPWHLLLEDVSLALIAWVLALPWLLTFGEDINHWGKKLQGTH